MPGKSISRVPTNKTTLEIRRDDDGSTAEISQFAMQKKENTRVDFRIER